MANKNELLDAAYAVYHGATDPAIPSGFAKVENTAGQDFFSVNNTATGLFYETYRNSSTNEYIVSFRGTNETTDWVNNATGGWFQFETNLAQIRNVLNFTTSASTAKVNITGHSLGGALAQFATYDYVQRSGSASVSELSLTTWNALGGQWALTDNSTRLYDSSFNANLLTNLSADH
jgi:hypothetical protein